MHLSLKEFSAKNSHRSSSSLSPDLLDGASNSVSVNSPRSLGRRESSSSDIFQARIKVIVRDRSGFYMYGILIS